MGRIAMGSTKINRASIASVEVSEVGAGMMNKARTGVTMMVITQGNTLMAICGTVSKPALKVNIAGQLRLHQCAWMKILKHVCKIMVARYMGYRSDKSPDAGLKSGGGGDAVVIDRYDQ